MQFQSTRRSRSKRNPLDDSQNAGKYAHGLQMYKVPPTDNITLEEFEEFAIDRLKGTRLVRILPALKCRYFKKPFEYCPLNLLVEGLSEKEYQLVLIETCLYSFDLLEGDT